MSHDKYCELLLAKCWPESKQHKKALAKKWGCEICNRWCDCDKIQRIRADERGGEQE